MYGPIEEWVEFTSDNHTNIPFKIASLQLLYLSLFVLRSIYSHNCMMHHTAEFDDMICLLNLFTRLHVNNADTTNQKNNKITNL